MKKKPIVQLADLEEELVLYGLKLQSFFASPGQVHIVLSDNVRPDSAIMYPPLTDRVETIRREIERRKVMGIAWIIESDTE